MQLWRNHNLCVFKLLSDNVVNVKKVLASRTDCSNVRNFNNIPNKNVTFAAYIDY
jgi:hypothetical protein